MNLTRSRAKTMASFTLLGALLWALPVLAASLPVAVTPQGDFAEIGKDLVLRLEVTLPQGVTLAEDQFLVTFGPADGSVLLDEPYPLRFLSAAVAGSQPPAHSGKVELEWVATVLTDAAPETKDFLATVQAGDDLTGTWSGSLKVDFGKEWDADKITSFIERRGMFFFLLLIL